MEMKNLCGREFAVVTREANRLRAADNKQPSWPEYRLTCGRLPGWELKLLDCSLPGGWFSERDGRFVAWLYHHGELIGEAHWGNATPYGAWTSFSDRQPMRQWVEIGRALGFDIPMQTDRKERK